MRRRLLLIALAAAVLLVALPLVVVHLPPVQAMIWEKARETIADGTGFEVSSERFRLRLLPARLEVEGISVAVGDERLAWARRLTATWHWRSILGQPQRLETVTVEELEVRIVEDVLPEASDDGDADIGSLLDAFEIGELRVVERGAEGSMAAVAGSLDGLVMRASLEGGRLQLAVGARQLRLTKSNRELVLGEISLAARGDARGLSIERLQLAGDHAEFQATGSARLSPQLEARADVRFAADIRAAARWWDPNIVTGLDPGGIVELEGWVAWDEEGLSANFTHEGGELAIVGYPIDRLELSVSEARPVVVAAHPSWGVVEAAAAGPTAVEISAEFTGAPCDRLLPFVAPRLGAVVGSPATVSGSLDATVSYPIVVDQLRAEADLELSWPDGRVAVVGAGSGREWVVSNAAAKIAGAAVSARGRLSGERVEATMRGRIERPGETARELAAWMPELDRLTVAGGPLEVDGMVSGSLSSPGVELRWRWASPHVSGLDFDSIVFEGSGGMEHVEWGLKVAVDPATEIHAHGTARPEQLAVAGSWQLRVDDLHSASGLVPELEGTEVGGAAQGAGEFSFDNGAVRAAGELHLHQLEMLGWTIPRGELRFAVDPETVRVEELMLEVLGGSIEGSGDVQLVDGRTEARSALRWRDLDLGQLPMDLPPAAAGRLSGFAEVEGSLQDPAGRLETTWTPQSETPLAERVDLTVSLDSGTIRAMTGVVESVVGPLVLTADGPLGSFDRPDWLWPDAPKGPVRARLQGTALDTSRLSEVTALPETEALVATNLDASLAWDPERPRAPVVVVEADGMRIRHSEGELAASGPVVAGFDGSTLRLEPVVFEGDAGRIAAEATVDTKRRWADGRLSARVAPSATRWLPVELDMDGTLIIEADLSGPAALERWREGARGSIRIDHRGGRLTRRDPPLEVRDLWIEASLDRWGLTVDEGSALVNRGRVELGGGWDPVSGQGLVAELDGVTLMAAGVLTRWGGNVVVEPNPDKLAKIGGNLTLLAGLWDETFSIGQAFLVGEEDVVPPDDPLHDIDLDLTVRQASRLRVDNNLGRFDASWDVLRV
ncbi:MAG: hypothetical protein PVG92_03950, partial [Holophagae bacterium]